MELLLDVLHSFCIIFRVKIAQSTLCSLPRIHAISKGRNQERENQKKHCSHFGDVFYFSYFYRTNFEMTLLPATLIKVNFFKMSELYQPETDWNMFCYVILISWKFASKWQMLKAPPLISSDLYILVLECHCRT